MVAYYDHFEIEVMFWIERVWSALFGPDYAADRRDEIQQAVNKHHK